MDIQKQGLVMTRLKCLKLEFLALEVCGQTECRCQMCKSVSRCISLYEINLSIVFVMFQPLEVYIFDDTDPEDTAYLGCAKIPLIPLAHDKPIKGIFELHNVCGCYCKI